MTPHSGPHVWNSLPTEIRHSCNNLLQFKSKLKTFLFQHAVLNPSVDPYPMRDLTNTLYSTTTTTTVHKNIPDYQNQANNN